LHGCGLCSPRAEGRSAVRVVRVRGFDLVAEVVDDAFALHLQRWRQQALVDCGSGRNHIRIAYTQPRARLEEAVARLRPVLATG